MKNKAIATFKTSKRIAANAEQFVQAASLLTIAVFSYWALHQLKLAEPAQWAITAALVVIGLRGAYEMIKFLDTERK